MRRFLACYNLFKNRIIQNTFMDRDITPYLICHSNFSVISPVTGEIFFSNWTHFWPLDILWDILAFVHQDLHNFYSIFRVFKVIKKDKNIMSCTRLYVHPTETLTGQGTKRIRARNVQSCRSCSPDLVLLKYWSPLSRINWSVPHW